MIKRLVFLKKYNRNLNKNLNINLKKNLNIDFKKNLNRTFLGYPTTFKNNYYLNLKRGYEKDIKMLRIELKEEKDEHINTRESLVYQIGLLKKDNRNKTDKIEDYEEKIQVYDVLFKLFENRIYDLNKIVNELDKNLDEVKES